MSFCEMCGIEVPMAPNGRCILGHRQGPSAAGQSVAVSSEGHDQESFAPVGQQSLSLQTSGSAALAPLQTSGSAALVPLPALESEPLKELFLVDAPTDAPKKGVSKSLILLAVFAVVAAGGMFVLRGSSSAPQPARFTPRKTGQVGAFLHAFVPGEVHTYHMAIKARTTLQIQSQSHVSESSADASFVEKVVSRSADGATTLRFTITGIDVNADGHRMSVPLPRDASVDVTLSPSGKVIAVASRGMPNDSSFGESFYSGLRPLLPANARVGSHWTSVDTVSVPNVTKPLSITNSYSLVREDASTALVHSESEGVIDNTQIGGSGSASGSASGRIHESGDTVVDRSTGRVVQLRGHMQTNLTINAHGQSGTMQLDMDIVLAPTSGAPISRSPASFA